MTVSVPSFSMPPPNPAELFTKVELVIVSVPSLAMPPPAPPLLTLLLKVQLVTASVPWLLMPPPSWLVLPPQMVRPERLAVVSLETENTWTVSLPVIFRSLAPGPSITSGPAVSDRSNVADRVIDCWRGHLKDGRVELDLAAGGIGVGVGLGDAVEEVARVVRPRAGIAREVDGVDRRRAGEEGPVLEPFEHREPATPRGGDASR